MQCTLTALLEFWVCSHDPISIQFTIGDDKHQKNVGHKRTDFNLRNLCHYTIDNKNTCYFETNASLGDFICNFFPVLKVELSKDPLYHVKTVRKRMSLYKWPLYDLFWPFFAICMSNFHKTEALTVILRCLTVLT